MALTSLLVCTDSKAVQILSRVLVDLGIQVEQCADPAAALERLATQPFDALLVDCKEEVEAMELMAGARTLLSNKTTLIIAMVDSQNHVRDVFAKGANFVLYKPISAERAGASLRTARSLMRRERRRHERVALHTPASMDYATTQNASTTLLDLSEEGVSIQCERKMPPRCKAYFQFNLPGQMSAVRLSGEVMWQDSSGRVGLRFVDVPHASRRVLKEWLSANVSREADAGATPRANQPSGLGLLSASAADRRERGRHACRLSADVYRVGSNVPYRCSLSDISNGGCYVETTEPFPAMTSVEIVVRTKEIKLRVRGSVQAAHQGFGMGVAFSIQTKEEREQVQQLIACQASESGILA